MRSQSSALDGLSIFIGLIALTVIGLKAAGYIEWSWWWVLGPMVVGLCLYVSLRK